MRHWLLLAQFWMIHATPWPGPSPTTSVKCVEAETLIKPTLAPKVDLELLRRATSSTTTSWSGWGVEVCGWENGEFDSIFSCSKTETCLWNTQNSVVGCGNTAVVPHFTACANYNSSSCGDSCSANPNILKCGRAYDNCYTINFPDGYMMPTCGFSANMSKTVDTTYGGLPTPIFLPRYLGGDNILTVETQFPYGQKPSSISGTAAKSTQTKSSSPEGEGKKKKSLVGPVVGGVLGGIVLIAAIGTGVWLFLRQKKRRNLETRGDGKVGGTVGMEGISTIAPPYELGGKPKPAYEIG